jgi:hypothetical protein
LFFKRKPLALIFDSDRYFFILFNRKDAYLAAFGRVLDGIIDEIKNNKFEPDGSRCCTMTKAMPLSGGIALKNCSKASSPPAESADTDDAETLLFWLARFACRFSRCFSINSL